MSAPSSPLTPHEVNRRTLVKGAAWSVPVIVAATATPFAAATTPTPNAASYAWTGLNENLPSGGLARYQLFGYDANDEPGALPVTAEITITPEPGVTLSDIAVLSPGATIVANPDGSLRVQITATDVTQVFVNFRVNGPLESGVNVITSIPETSTFEEIRVRIR